MPPRSTWKDYPAGVPLADRVACCVDGCERAGEVVLLDHGSLLGPAVTGRSAFTAAFCLEHALAAGYEPDEPARPAAPPLNRVQRWLVRLLGHGSA